MEYTIREIKDGIATIDYTDGSWAGIPMNAGLSQEDFEAAVIAHGPKSFEAPAWATTGTFNAKPADIIIDTTPAPEGMGTVDADGTITPSYMLNRREAYGDPSFQLEFITENGLEAWRTYVASVKKMFPKEA